ncbi:MAG: hypothetical protein KBD78_11030 [Oligoflexales bacterium]|nr:hypothetical protein [Oligoflexales bacterium]
MKPETLKIIFSLKESLFKALFPICLQHFYFLDAELISIDFKQGVAELILRRTLTSELESGCKFSANFVLLKEQNQIISLVAVN